MLAILEALEEALGPVGLLVFLAVAYVVNPHAHELIGGVLQAAAAGAHTLATGQIPHGAAALAREAAPEPLLSLFGG